jgi:hypothetical protein
MSGLLLICFLASALFAVFFTLRSRHTIAARLALVGATLLFGLVAYLVATSSTFSPFSRSSSIAFGVGSQATGLFIVVALTGAVAGVFGSYFFKLGNAGFSVRGLLRPLSASPLVIIPTIKLIESAGDPTALAYILLFALSYQNGFFWERLLKE